MRPLPHPLAGAGLAALVLAASSLSACLGPPNPMQRLGDVAYEMNGATRFGRMDVALGHVAADSQVQFAERHASWGDDVRVLDLELTSVRMVDERTAEVVVVVQWHRIDETSIRTTRLAQRYEEGGDDWRLVEERRTGGAKGLFRAQPAEKAKSEAEPSEASDAPDEDPDG